ncbi:biopolymer transporter Tol [Pontibacter silvestris]|uniref:Biopolymer transporter Tol n=1 Tax=Pontibacter silvestris TaxID=2305183 RepID=A0ABW4X0D8_9BACT|nr:biopolymer transporter Tol [Pontibacter silvestris]MCC9135574.1 biopolymer transporter Tol [Pontibacter silvestris]
MQTSHFASKAVKQQILFSPVKISTRFIIAGAFSIGMLSTTFAQTVGGIDYSDRANVDKTFDMAGTDIFGQRFPSESLTITDPVTGVEVLALTTSRHSSSKIYQDHPNWTADGKYIIFSSNRNTSAGGNITFANNATPRRQRQFYAVSMDTHEIVQVTTGDNIGDLLLGHKQNVAFRVRNNQVVEVNLGELLAESERGKVKDAASYEKVVATIPADLKPGGMCLDINDERIFFSTRAGEDASAIYSVELDSNKTTKLIEVPFRTGHFQANPFVSGEMMYCWETGGDSPQRIWVLSVDKKGKVTNRPVYQEKADEWVTHEVFVGPDHIMFNIMGHLDRLRKNPTGLMMLNIRTNESQLLGQAKELGGYWHAAGTQDLKWAVGDSFDGNIYRIDIEKGIATLLTTGHRPNTKSPFSSQAHAHQSISPDGKWVLFNSSLLTDSDIMMVPLHPEGI